MSAARSPAMLAALRPRLQADVTRLQPFAPAYARMESSSPSPSPRSPAEPGVGDKGTAKAYNKDGTNPNKNLMYGTATIQ